MYQFTINSKLSAQTGSVKTHTLATKITFSKVTPKPKTKQLPAAVQYVNSTLRTQTGTLILHLEEKSLTVHSTVPRFH